MTELTLDWRVWDEWILLERVPGWKVNCLILPSDYFSCDLVPAVGVPQSGRVGMWSGLHGSPAQFWKGWKNNKEKLDCQGSRCLHQVSSVCFWSLMCVCVRERERERVIFVLKSQFRLAEQQLSITLFLHYSSISSLDLLPPVAATQFRCLAVCFVLCCFRTTVFFWPNARDAPKSCCNTDVRHTFAHVIKVMASSLPRLGQRPLSGNETNEVLVSNERTNHCLCSCFHVWFS